VGHVNIGLSMCRNRMRHNRMCHNRMCHNIILEIGTRAQSPRYVTRHGDARPIALNIFRRRCLEIEPLQCLMKRFWAEAVPSMDKWQSLGNPGWGWADLEPYFQRARTLHLPSNPKVYEHLHLDYVDERVRGRSGPIHASFPDDLDNLLLKAWIGTLSTLDHPCTGNPFSGEITEAYTNAASIDPVVRQRSYPASAYLEPVRHRSNLAVITGANAQTIILSGSSPGVVAQDFVYVEDDQTMEVRASKEVILATGAIH